MGRTCRTGVKELRHKDTKAPWGNGWRATVLLWRAGEEKGRRRRVGRGRKKRGGIGILSLLFFLPPTGWSGLQARAGCTLPARGPLAAGGVDLAPSQSGPDATAVPGGLRPGSPLKLVILGPRGHVIRRSCPQAALRVESPWDGGHPGALQVHALVELTPW